MSGTRPPARLALVALCAATLVACGGSNSSSSSSSPSNSTPPSSSPSSASPSIARSTAAITIKDFTFTTPPSVSPGATVTVDNQDGTAHTVTSDTGDAFDDAAPPGASSFVAPTKPGSYPFHCNIHPEMHGTLVVK
jgi:plastocyanin